MEPTKNNNCVIKFECSNPRGCGFFEKCDYPGICAHSRIHDLHGHYCVSMQAIEEALNEECNNE